MDPLTPAFFVHFVVATRTCKAIMPEPNNIRDECRSPVAEWTQKDD
jgi:hypothetical protein